MGQTQPEHPGRRSKASIGKSLVGLGAAVAIFAAALWLLRQSPTDDTNPGPYLVAAATAALLLIGGVILYASKE